MRRGILVLVLVGLVNTAAASFPGSRRTLVSPQEEKKQTSEQSIQLEEATSLSAKVVEFYKQKKYNEALPLAKRALDIRNRILGEQSGLTAAAKLNLAELYLAKAEYGIAESLYQQLLAVYESVFGIDNINNAIIIDSLALANYLKRDFKRAEMFYARAVSLKEKTLGPDSVEVAEAAYNLAEFYRSRGAYSKAEPLFLRAIQISDKVFGIKRPEAQRFVQRYVCFLFESKSEADAVKLEHKLWESRFPENTQGTGDIINGKALSLPIPPYPEDAHAVGASGVVRVQIKIDEQGRVIEAKAICGQSLLTKAAEDAALRALFSPTKLNGVPVKTNGIVIYRFIRPGGF